MQGQPLQRGLQGHVHPLQRGVGEVVGEVVHGQPLQRGVQGQVLLLLLSLWGQVVHQEGHWASLVLLLRLLRLLLVQGQVHWQSLVMTQGESPCPSLRVGAIQRLRWP